MKNLFPQNSHLSMELELVIGTIRKDISYFRWFSVIFAIFSRFTQNT